MNPFLQVIHTFPVKLNSVRVDVYCSAAACDWAEVARFGENAAMPWIGFSRSSSQKSSGAAEVGGFSAAKSCYRIRPCSFCQLPVLKAIFLVMVIERTEALEKGKYVLSSWRSQDCGFWVGFVLCCCWSTFVLSVLVNWSETMFMFLSVFVELQGWKGLCSLQSMSKLHFT